MTRRWYEFSKLEIALSPVVIIGVYALLGWPHGLQWLGLPPAIMLGRAFGWLLDTPWRRRR